MDEREVIESIKNTYLSHHKENTLKHVEEVSGTAVWLAIWISRKSDLPHCFTISAR